MTLKEATENMTAALRDQDLPALAAALADRATSIRAAIKAGAQPTAEIVEAGNRAVYDLLILKQSLAFESARLEQVRASLAGAMVERKVSCLDYHA
jgi:hypothetical protein